MTKYKVGDIVMFRPNWPTKPAFGIWMKDNPPEGKVFRISTLPMSGSGTYYGQFDPDNDHSFHSAHWPCKEDEILGYASE